MEEVARELGRFSLDAFEFLQRGLDYTVKKIHGPPDPVLRKLGEWMEANDIDLSDLELLTQQDKVPPPVTAAIEHFGGSRALREKFNRHVGGDDLSWGLREYALEQWGILAPSVLKSWGIRCTMDYGRMVFVLVENGLLQKQPEDNIEDFKDVYDFDRAFTDSYKISFSNPKRT